MRSRLGGVQKTSQTPLHLARDRVCRWLASQVRRFPDLSLTPIETEGLSSRDGAFAHALCDAVVRRWLTLEWALERATKRPIDALEPKLRAALMAGAAQILFMDRVPLHAAVNETTEWAKRSIRPGAGGLTNAALRRVGELAGFGEETSAPTRREQWTDRRDELPMSDGRPLALREEALPVDAIQRLSVATSHPVELLRMLSKASSLREARRLAHHDLATAPIILNTAHLQRPIEMTTESGEPAVRPHTAPGHHVFVGSYEQLSELLSSRDDVWAQDPASSLAVESVADLTPGLVIDVCAGRGTKTRQLANQFPKAKIIATDISAERRQALEKVFEGEERVQVVHHKELDAWAGKADLVLVDAPCSNTGVLARRVEAKYRTSKASSEQLVSLQRQILADSLRLLADAGKGGSHLLYSTCSLDSAENEEQVRWMERWHGLRAERMNRRPPGGGPGEPPERYSDGSFAVAML